MNERRQYYSKCKERVSEAWSSVLALNDVANAQGRAGGEALMTALRARLLECHKRLKTLKRVHEGTFAEQRAWFETTLEELAEGRSAFRTGDFDKVSWFKPTGGLPQADTVEHLEVRLESAAQTIHTLRSETESLEGQLQSEVSELLDDATKTKERLEQEVELVAAGEGEVWREARAAAQELWRTLTRVLTEAVTLVTGHDKRK